MTKLQYGLIHCNTVCSALLLISNVFVPLSPWWLFFSASSLGLGIWAILSHLSEP
jgi:NO-binding membrane sensor protein with MHYT domain